MPPRCAFHVLMIRASLATRQSPCAPKYKSRIPGRVDDDAPVACRQDRVGLSHSLCRQPDDVECPNGVDLQRPLKQRLQRSRHEYMSQYTHAHANAHAVTSRHVTYQRVRPVLADCLLRNANTSAVHGSIDRASKRFLCCIKCCRHLRVRSRESLGISASAAFQKPSIDGESLLLG
jgi:hypothetical protein